MEMQNKITIFKSKDGEINLDVKFKDDTLWLNQGQMAELFDVNQPAIAKHLSNIFRTGELDEKSVHSILEYTAADKKKYKTKFYNLDAVISVGYRVNSKKATDFRVWATKVLKNYLVQGYVLNERKFEAQKAKLAEIKKTLLLIGEKSEFETMKGHERELIDLIAEYAKSWKLLEGFDEEILPTGKLHNQIRFEISYDGTIELVGKMKDQLQRIRLNVYLFGNQVGEKLRAIVGSVNQTFDGKDLYPSVEEKAAHILYLTIKDHPFSDGNKRIASMMFLYFLENNDFLKRKDGVTKVSDNTLVALALLVATSNPREKDNIIKLIINLLQE
ncbi:MAG: virulence protein RhuM/Fic/DOC family protein [Candidatus Berkelbacteria bacterium]